MLRNNHKDAKKCENKKHLLLHILLLKPTEICLYWKYTTASILRHLLKFSIPQKPSLHNAKVVSPKLYLIQWFYIFLKSSHRFVGGLHIYIITVFSSTLKYRGGESRFTVVCETQFILELFIIVLFSIQTTINLLLPHPVFVRKVY